MTESLPASAPPLIRVVLVDDQELFRSGVAVAVDAQPDMEVVGQAGDGLRALDVVAQTHPDVVLMDMRMPVMDGVEATRRLFLPDVQAVRASSGRGRDLKVIVLTTFNLDDAAATAIRYGASGFLLKDSTPEFLAAAIRAVHAGTAVLAPGELGALMSRTGLVDRALPVPDSFAGLTERERAIFDGASRGLSNAEIAAREFVSESTVKTHVSNILTKLGLRDRVQLVVFAHRHGLVD